ncbi:MAG: EAL domain-containing protein [Alphaproteobacteria bacterium]|nr:EAL domain-containing protein [Alphaproteobacteria bacterium]
MSIKNDILEQRDRFLAFSLASADLMLEIDSGGRVVYSFGAAKRLTGVDSTSLVGCNFADFVSDMDKPVLNDLMQSALPGKRCQPTIIVLLGRQKKEPEKILLTAIRMPENPSLYVTLAFPKSVVGDALPASALPPLNHKDFAQSAQAAIAQALESGNTLDMTFLDMPDLEKMKSRVSQGEWDRVMAMMGDLLKKQSADGQSVAQISENRFGLLHAKDITADSIQQQVSALLKQADPTGAGVDVSGVSIEASAGALSDAEVSRALMYTLKEFEKKGSDMAAASMQEGFKNYIVENAAKIQKLKAIINTLAFTLHFQPIVDLHSLRSSHYEMLTRFRDGTPPYQWITFAEEVGLASEFDLAICNRAIKYVAGLPRTKNNKFAVNLSGQSVQNPKFIEELRKLTRSVPGLSELIMFEITESANISDLDFVNNFIGELHDDGFKVCLDDFGAGSASFQYLHKLNVDYVKLDGEYVKDILTNKRNQTMIKSMAGLCADLGISMVAERVETEKEAALLRSLQVQYGQGYWFGKPAATPEYAVDEKKLALLSSLKG